MRKASFAVASAFPLLVLAQGLPTVQPVQQALDAPCAKVWSHALGVFVKAGFGPRTAGGTDREAGIMDLEYRQGQRIASFYGGGSKPINKLVGQYTTAKSTGFWTQYKGFRIHSANVLLSEGDSADKCLAEVNIVFHGYEHRVRGGGEGWWVLESNGSMEREILAQIQERLSPGVQSVPSPTASQQEERHATEKAPTPPATEIVIPAQVSVTKEPSTRPMAYFAKDRGSYHITNKCFYAGANPARMPESEAVKLGGVRCKVCWPE